MDEKRPSPEEMLARAAGEAARAGRGHLKVFFGAAPGVGKTYAMLEAARARRREGRDVVIGWVESHGREETAALARDLEALPPRTVSYRGIDLREFDLDGALARRPWLLLLDELAHTNADGSRHVKRWQEVEELLRAGIHVYSTLNVQHLESMNDLVARITGVVVQETLPDSVLDLADEIEVVDLPPEELLQRMREGKVYLPAQASRAMEGFFRKGNLSALRELALRKAAERVDTAVEQWKRDHGVKDVWPTRERILAAVGPSPASADVVRAAYRMAERLRAPWIAACVESTGFDSLPEEDRERAATHIALAKGLGAETFVVQGDRVAEELLSLARRRNVTRIVVGRPTRPRWRELLKGSLVDELVRGAHGIDIMVSAAEPEAPRAPPAPVRPPEALAGQYGLAVAAVAVPTLLSLAAHRILTLPDEVMIYLLGVVLVAARVRRGPSLVNAVLSVAALDFFFVPPRFEFSVDDRQYLLTFTVMLAVGLAVSTLTIRNRERAEGARERERRTAALFAVSRDLAVEREPVRIALASAKHVRELLECEAVVMISEPDPRLVPKGGPDGTGWLDEKEVAVARWVYRNGRPAGVGTETLPGGRALYLPLVGSGAPVGVVGLVQDPEAGVLSPSQRQFLEAVVAMTAISIERASLEEEAAAARVSAETERTRSALLSAVSHDLRTPLASIRGSAGVLLDGSAALDPAERRELAATIQEEAVRLGRLVGDLLDLTRLESGGFQVRREWCPLEEVVHSATARSDTAYVGREVRVDLPREVLLVPMDPILVEQVLVNLLENGARYSPPGTPLEIAAWTAPGGGTVDLEVRDRGPGIPAGEEEKIFQRYYRAGDGLRKGGAGLGLTVCQAILRVHGGTIRASNREGGGAAFRFTLPLTGLPPPSEEKPAREG